MKGFLFAPLALLLGAHIVQAASVTVDSGPVAIPNGLNSFSATGRLSVDGFDTNLGQLTAVNVSLSGSLRLTGSIAGRPEPAPGVGAFFDAFTQTQIRDVTVAQLPVLGQTFVTPIGRCNTLPTCSLTADFVYDFDHSYTLSAQTAFPFFEDQTVVASLSSLATPFVRQGALTSNDLDIQDFFATLEVEYVFEPALQPVPLPASLPLSVLGIGALIVLGRQHVRRT